MVIKYEVDPNQEFQQAVKKAAADVKDLTIPLTLITQSWFKSNQAIFAVKGRGRYTDLAPDSGLSTYDYKTRKRREVGFIYPILRKSGVLERSITVPGAPYQVDRIINKKTLVLGSSVPYGGAHQFGYKNIPARPFILIGAEQVAPPELNRRLDAWVDTLRDFVVKKSERVGKVKK